MSLSFFAAALAVGTDGFPYSSLVPARQTVVFIELQQKHPVPPPVLRLRFNEPIHR
jgi:hypothetical protein